MISTAPDPGVTAPYGDDVDYPEAGRPVVLEPPPPGMWRGAAGMAVAVLAPLPGFLVGGVLGAGTMGESVDPMFIAFRGHRDRRDRTAGRAVARGPAVAALLSEELGRVLIRR
jgi:hypothetical protein